MSKIESQEVKISMDSGLVDVTLSDQLEYFYAGMRTLADRDEKQALARRSEIFKRAFLAGPDGVAPLALILDICGIYKNFVGVSEREFLLSYGRRQVADQLLKELKII